MSDDGEVSSGQQLPTKRKRDTAGDDASLALAAAEAAAARGEGRRKAKAPKRANPQADVAAEPTGVAAEFLKEGGPQAGPADAAWGSSLGPSTVPRTGSRPGIAEEGAAADATEAPSDHVQQPAAAAALSSLAVTAVAEASAVAPGAAGILDKADPSVDRQPPGTPLQRRLPGTGDGPRLTLRDESPQPRPPAAANAARQLQAASSSSNLTPDPDWSLPISYGRTPRAAAPLPGQLREDSPRKPAAAAKKAPPGGAAAAVKRKAPAEAAAPAAVKARPVRGLAPKKKLKKPLVAATAAADVHDGEAEQLERAAAYREAAGALFLYLLSTLRETGVFAPSGWRSHRSQAMTHSRHLTVGSSPLRGEAGPYTRPETCSCW